MPNPDLARLDGAALRRVCSTFAVFIFIGIVRIPIERLFNRTRTNFTCFRFVSGLNADRAELVSFDGSANRVPARPFKRNVLSDYRCIGVTGTPPIWCCICQKKATISKKNSRNAEIGVCLFAIRVLKYADRRFWPGWGGFSALSMFRILHRFSPVVRL